MSEDTPRRTVAEWCTFGVSVAVLLALIGLIGRDLLVEERPADPVATVVGEPRRVGGQHVVTVEVENRGDATATQVTVSAELSVGDQVHSSDQEVEQVAGHAKEEIEVVLPQDPADGELTVRVTGFQHP